MCRPLPGIGRCPRGRCIGARACQRQGSRLNIICSRVYAGPVYAGDRPLAYGKISVAVPVQLLQETQGGPGRTVRRLQGYPVSRASEPRELPCGDHPMPRTRKDRQGLPVVNGRRSLSTGSLAVASCHQEKSNLFDETRAFNCPSGQRWTSPRRKSYSYTENRMGHEWTLIRKSLPLLLGRIGQLGLRKNGNCPPEKYRAVG